MPADEGDFRANPVWYAASRGRNLALVKFLLKRGGAASYYKFDVPPGVQALLKFGSSQAPLNGSLTFMVLRLR